LLENGPPHRARTMQEMRSKRRRAQVRDSHYGAYVAEIGNQALRPSRGPATPAGDSPAKEREQRLSEAAMSRAAYCSR